MARTKVKIFSGKRSSVEGRINSYLYGDKVGKLVDVKITPLNAAVDPNDSNPPVLVMLTLEVKN